MSKGLPHSSNVVDSVLDTRNLDCYFIKENNYNVKIEF